ncbi:LysR family transcriptional regulator [Levilactobacillus suantsaii]|nr:LysR family transcriptional regulator [Levilactobacillus suantsaii]QMU07644.1 LysR family transcriptional regulator [Levilactobacillus suantsaii]
MLDMMSLAIFELVVTNGSFTQAAAHGYLTPPAVKRRIEELEKQIGVTLFLRTAQGVQLTAAGKLLHQQAPALINHSESLLKQVQHYTGSQAKVIRIGTSTLNPASRQSALWAEVSRQLPDYRFQFIPLETLNMGFPMLYQHLGEQVDLLVGPSGFQQTPSHIHFYQLATAKLTLTMCQTDALARQAVIQPDDLVGTKLALIPQYESNAIDQVYDYLAQAQIKFTAMAADAHYTIETFNRDILPNQPLLTLDCWPAILPGTVTRPLNLPVSIPYGIMAPLKLTPAMVKLTNVVQQIIDN